MAHQQQPSHPPYNNNGGRGRGNNNHTGGRGGGGGGNPNNNNHNSGGYQNSGNHNYPNMNYATPGRGGGGGAWHNHHQSPHHNMHHQQQPHHPAYSPGPTGVPAATAAVAAASTVGTPNATPQLAPAISAPKPPQQPGVVAGAAGPTAIQSPPLNSSLQQSLQQGVSGGVTNQHQRTPSSNLQPAPPAVPHTYGGATPQQQHQQQQQYRQQQQLQSPIVGMPNQQQHYNNPYHQHPQYGGVANQYGYPPAYQRQHQQQWEQQQMQYNAPNGGNNPYATGGMVRTPVGAGAGAMYYPVMQQPHMTPGVTPTNGGVGTTPTTGGSSLMNAAMAAIGTGASTTPNVVVPPPRPKKILTITDKDGNVIDFSSMKNTKTTATPPTGAASVASSTSKTSTTAATSTTTPSAPTAVSQSSTTSSAYSSKLYQVALARIEGKDIKSSDDIESIDATPAATATPPTPTLDFTTNTTSSESIDTPLATKTETKEMEGAVSVTQTNDDATKTLPTTKTEIDDDISQITTKKSSLEEQLTKSSEAVVDIVTPKASSTAVEVATKNNDIENAKFFIYTKKILLGLKELPECMKRPDDLPEMEIVRTEVRAGGSNRPGPTGGGGGNSGRRNSSQRNMDNSSNSAGGGGGGDQWARGNTAPPRRQSSQSDRPQNANNTATPDQWSRGQAPPKQQGPNANAKGAGRSTRGSFAQVYEEPVEPLVKSENHWRPKKNTSAFVVAEKKVKSILNKMTKEKFDRLSEQMLEIPLLSYETLNMIINHVYEKAIDEPAFGELYANLCHRLSQIASDNKFVHIIESDEEPPTDDGEVTTSVTTDNIDDTDGRNKVYRWSHDVSTTDAEIIGPLSSVDECMTAPFDGTERTPIPRGDTELELVNVIIRRTLLIKIMKKKSAEDAAETADNNEYYVVYFPVKEAEECGQQISEIFLSEVECRSDASKKNSFKRSLLNKCEEEFNKKDIYDNWQKEKQQYEEMKSKLTDQERAIQESELNFRRIKIKKQMLGNVKFIGQLYKVNLLREKVMRFCIGSMLKLEERKDIKAKNPEYEDTGNTDMDEEDHEAICNMFATIGSTIDKPPAADFMKVCFQKIDRLIQDKNLPSRSKFMYKDLIDLRSNNWVPRRKEEKAKTIAEIREDVEAEERRQAQLSAQLNARSTKNDPRSSGRNDFYQQRQTSLGAAAAAGISGNRPRIAKPVVRTDDDGFTTVAGPSRSNLPGAAIISAIKPVPSMMKTNPNANVKVVAPLTQSELERRIKGMRSDYISTNGNVPELLLSWDEIATTPNAGVDLVRKNIETLMECKDTERNAIYKMIRDLCEKGKLTKSDVQTGLSDNIEFIDDIVVDCPRAYEFLGTLIGDMLQIKMFDIKWLCDQCEKTKESNPDSIASEKLLRFALVQWKKLSNSETVRSQIQANDVRLRQLTGPSALQAIIGEI